MDFTKPIVYNSLSINAVTTSAGGRPTSGYLCDGLDIYASSARAYVSDLALHDGGQAGDIYLRPQPMQLIVSVYGSTAGDYWDKVQDLRRAFSPRIAYEADTSQLGFLPLTFYQPTADIATWPTSAYPNGIPLQYRVRPSGRIAESARRDNTGGQSNKGVSGRFAIPLLAIDPIKYNQTETSASIGVFSSTATNRGDYPTWGTVSIVATTTTAGSHVIFHIGSDYFTVNITGTTATYVLNMRDRTLTRDGVAFVSGLAGSPTFNELQPGGTAIGRSTVLGGDTTISATLTFRDAFT